jgi:hypothetical protein
MGCSCILGVGSGPDLGGGVMSTYRHQKYTWSKPFGSVRHQWELIGGKGGLHFHASEYKGDWSCGLEVHRLAPQSSDVPPSQVPCWLLHAPCWHDGTSLYATESVWPIIEGAVKRGDHDYVFKVLEREADGYFNERKTDDDEDVNESSPPEAQTGRGLG